MVTTFEKITGFGVEGYSSGSPAMVLVSVDTSTKLAAITSSSLKAKAQGKRRIIDSREGQGEVFLNRRPADNRVRTYLNASPHHLQNCTQQHHKTGHCSPR